MESKKRPTQLDVARKSGFSRPTVSLALKGDPIVCKETRRLIREAADAIGYVPDPMLTALARYRNQHARKSYQGTLAWISWSTGKTLWSRISAYQQYFNGAKEHAAGLGYKIETIDMMREDLTVERLDRILATRGIKGLLVCPPVLSEQPVELPWENYSLITFGYTIAAPRIHRVTSSHFQATQQVFQRLHDHGYRRIGFICNHQLNAKTRQHSLAAYLSERHRTSLPAIPELVDPVVSPAKIKAWHRRHKPDAVIISWPDWLTLKSTDIRVPEQLGVACPMAQSSEPTLSGVVEQSQEIGAVAVDSLVHMIEHGNKGLPAHPRYILLEGEWQDGRTLRV